MGRIPQVRISAYLPFVDYMERHGDRTIQKFDDSLLRAISERDSEALVPMQLAHAFLINCANRTGLPDLGYAVGQHAKVQHLGAFGQNLLRSLTLHDALEKVHSTFALFSSAERLSWERRGSSVVFEHRYLQHTGPGQAYAQQCALMLMRDLVRQAAGSQWQPEMVRITPMHDATATRQAFETDNVQYAETCALVFSTELLRHPLDPLLHEVMEIGTGAFGASVPSPNFPGAVKQTIAALMSHGFVRLPSIAAALGIHPRTLQRTLRDNQQEFSQLLAEVRFEAAARLLEDPKVKVIDIACELGYTDPANFSRAFRHWTGASPADYRRQKERIPIVAK